MMRSPFEIGAVKRIHLELTETCNASCPMCVRNHQGGRVRDYVTSAELSLADIKALLPPDLLGQLDHIFACGNLGDPGAARDCLEIFRYFRETNPRLRLTLFTNGGMRSPAWWRELATLFPSSSEGDFDTGHVRFAIDGGPETNHIHRKGVRWTRLFENVSAFTSAGGAAEWDFLVFRHNENEIDDLRALARQLGFRAFHVKASNRFLDPASLAPLDRAPVRNNDGEIEYYIEPPQNAEWLNPRVSDISALANTAEVLDSCTIHCRALDEATTFINARGQILPCCWLGMHANTGRYRDFASLLSANGGTATLDAKQYPIEQIMQGDIFAAVAETWEKDREQGRLHTCARFCGQGVDQSRGQRIDSVRIS